MQNARVIGANTPWEEQWIGIEENWAYVRVFFSLIRDEPSVRLIDQQNYPPGGPPLLPLLPQVHQNLVLQNNDLVTDVIRPRVLSPPAQRARVCKRLQRTR